MSDSAPATPPADATTPDEELLTRLRARDERAFEELVRRYHTALVRLARQYVPNEAVAEEVAQETWLGVINGLDRFEGRSSLKTWLFRILMNRAMTRGVRERRSVPVGSFAETRPEDEPTVPARAFTREGAWVTPPRPFELPQDRLETLELRGQIKQALAELPERQRIAVTLRDVEGLPTEEVAELMEISPGNLRVLLHRGRARLQQALAGYING